MCIHFGTESWHKQVGHPRRLSLPATVGIRRRNNYVSPATVISNLANIVDLSYHKIRPLQRHQYLASGKWQMYIHSSHGYTPSKWANIDPGNNQMGSNLIQGPSSVSTIVNCGTYHHERPWHVCYSNSLLHEAE
jgi:hypothetical protein